MIKSIKVVCCDICDKEISRGEDIPDDLGTIDVYLGLGERDQKSNKIICSFDCMKAELQRLLMMVNNWQHSE